MDNKKLLNHKIAELNEDQLDNVVGGAIIVFDGIDPWEGWCHGCGRHFPSTVRTICCYCGGAIGGPLPSAPTYKYVCTACGAELREFMEKPLDKPLDCLVCDGRGTVISK